MNQALRAELIARYDADQAALARSLKISERLGWAPLQDELLTSEERDDLTHTRRVQRENVARLREIVDRFGWPDRSMVGDDGAEAAWLLAQHADADPELQKRCAELIGAAHERGLVESEHFAGLTDRVALASGEPQAYATELVVVDGAWTVRQPCDLRTAARLRAELGLNSIEEEIRKFQDRHPAGPVPSDDS